jgi:predicted alpha/beta-hydrolase family hydrolase
MGADETLEVPTPSGPARVRLTFGDSTGLLCLGHGAGGGTDAPDLLAVTAAAAAAGWTVARIDQPYRVAGRRPPAPAPRLDEAWLTVVAGLRARFPDGPLVTGGRSSGARVACRTAIASGATGVVCLAFPLRPPQRAQSSTPPKSRLDELLAAGVPVLVVQGERDPFGGPADFPSTVDVVAVPGDHSLRRSTDAVAAAVAGWLAQRVA